MLSIVLVCMLATQTAVCAQDKAGLINKAQETYRTFKKDMKCVFSKQPCTNEQKKRLIKQGAALTGIVVVLAGLGIGGGLGIGAWWQQHGKQGSGFEPIKKAPPTKESEEEIQADELVDVPQTKEKIPTQMFAKNKAIAKEVEFFDVKEDIKDYFKAYWAAKGAFTQANKEVLEVEFVIGLNAANSYKDAEVRDAYAKILTIMRDKENLWEE